MIIKPAQIPMDKWLKLSDKQKALAGMLFRRSYTRNQIRRRLFIGDRQFRRMRNEIIEIIKS